MNSTELTSEAQYQAACERYLEATWNLRHLRQMVKDAEQEFYAATEVMASHESAPGIPLYLQMGL